MLNAEVGKIKINFNMGKTKSVRLGGTFLSQVLNSPGLT